MDYELGQNDLRHVNEMDLSALTAGEVLEQLSDCVCSDEIVLFLKLLLLPSARAIDKNELIEPFFFACTGGRLAHVLALIEHGIDPNIQSDKGETALSSAAAWGNDAVVIKLINSGAHLQSSAIEYNEELDLVLSNCTKFTILEVLADTHFLADDVRKIQTAKLAAARGRNDLYNFLIDDDLG